MARRSALLAAVVLVLSIPAHAQPRDDVRARLTSFSPWAAPDRPLALTVEIANASATPLEDVLVRLRIRDRVRSRSSLRAALDGNASGNLLAETTEGFDRPIDVGETVTVSVERDLGSLATAFRVGRAIDGVYPLGIRVEAAGRTVLERAGAFVFLGTAPQQRLNLVWVMPLHRPLAADPRDGYDRATLARELPQGSRLRATADLVARHPTVPLTLAPTGLLADQLLDIANGFTARGGGGGTAVQASDAEPRAAADLLARLRTAIASPTYEIATATYARASLARLAASGLSLDAGRQIGVAQQRVESGLARKPNPALFVDGLLSADTRSVRTIAALGAKTLVLDPDALRDPPQGPFGPDQVQKVRSSRLSFDALLVDTPIRERLELPSEDPVLTAMGAVAETAASYFERPALSAGRLLVVGTPNMIEPAVATPLLDALAQAPWLRIRTASDAAADPGLHNLADEPRRLDVADAEASARMEQARAARRTVDVFESILVRPSGAEEVARLEHLLLASESADYDRRQRTAVALARAVRDGAQEQLAKITVPPRRVTLTRRGGQVPVTIRNRTGYSIRLRVELESPRVAFPAGRARQINGEGRPRATSLETLTFRIEARAAGSFPITVRVETPDGREVIGTGQVQVRSSAVSAVTLMATAGGALFLVGAWARRALSRRPKAGATS